MTIPEILRETDHRPWQMPAGKWKYYQEWNEAVFLHWQVDLNDLERFVPDELEIDLYDGSPWISMVAFTMENIRPKNLPSFPPISDFHELNIRTYVKTEGKSGVYFLSIEGGKKASCKIARQISGLPYRPSDMDREEGGYLSVNSNRGDRFAIEYRVGAKNEDKTTFDQWITERYALFQDDADTINAFDIHHLEWPIYNLALSNIEITYPRFRKLLTNSPDEVHYSPGVQVIAWSKKELSNSSLQV